MATDIGARIQLEGEAQFKQAVRDIDTNLKTLSSSLELSSTKFTGQEKTVEALTERQKGLKDVFDKQQEKVNQLRQAVEKSTEKYGDSSNKTLNWQTQLNKAETALEKTKQQLEETNTALESSSEGMDDAAKSTDKYADKTDDAKKSGMGFGDILDKLSNKLGVQLPENAKNTLNSLGSIDAASLAIVGTFAALAAAIVKVEQALIDMTTQSAAYVDEILTMSAKTGIAVDALQEYSYAAELLDVDVETITGSQTKLIRAMESAADGSKSQTDAFRQLGVQFKNSDGTLRDSEETFWDIIDALGAMENDTERDAVAMELMGKSAQDLNPLIKAGSDEMKKYAQEAHNVGYVLSTEQVTALGKVDDAMQRYNKTLDATKNTLSAQFAPYLEKAMTNLGDFVSKLGTSLEQSGIVKAFGMLLETISNLISPSDTMARSTIPGLVNALKPLAQIVATLADTIGVIANLLTGNFRGASQSLGFLYQWGKGNNFQNLMDYYQQTDVNNATTQNGYGQYYANGKWYSNYNEYLRAKFEESGSASTFEYWKMANGYNASGTDFFRGGYTWVGENGPELVSLPEGSRITPASESADVGGDTIFVTIDAKNVKEFNDIVDMAKTARMRARKK